MYLDTNMYALLLNWNCYCSKYLYVCVMLWFYFSDFWPVFFFLNATIVWHVATALCNIQQQEEWENYIYLDIIMCLSKVCGCHTPQPSGSQWVSVWPSLMYFFTKSGFLLGDSYWWVSKYELIMYLCQDSLWIKNKERSFALVSVVSVYVMHHCYCLWTHKRRNTSHDVTQFL